MKIFNILLLSFFIILYQGFDLFAQQPPCMNNFHGLTYSYSHLDYVPSLSVNMPYEVMLGYIVLDSARRYSNYKDIQDFLVRQNHNDTVQYLMKYYYQTVDYDPIRFELTLHFWDQYGLFPVELENMIASTIKRVSPNPYLDGLLMKSRIIAHVRVVDTLRRTDPSAEWAKTIMIVTCEVLETIKGKILPNCKDISLYYDPLIKTKKEKIQSENCIQFEYSLEFPKLSKDEVTDDITTTIVDDNGNQIWPPTLLENGQPWTIKDNEYIVFLDYHLICKDSINSYFTLSSYLDYSKTGNMYPIINGNVQDPDNELGFGTSINVNTFKTLINSRINEICNFGN